MRSSSAGAEMLADKEKAAENTLCILKGFDAVMRAFPPGRTACALVNRRKEDELGEQMTIASIGPFTGGK